MSEDKLSTGRLVRWFRKVAYAEGVSFLLLLGIAMPLKYVWGMPEAVKAVGWVHGILFIVYCYFLWQLYLEAGWGLKRVALGFVAALLPFGPFVFDRRLVVQNQPGGR